MKKYRVECNGKRYRISERLLPFCWRPLHGRYDSKEYAENAIKERIKKDEEESRGWKSI